MRNALTNSPFFSIGIFVFIVVANRFLDQWLRGFFGSYGLSSTAVEMLMFFSIALIGYFIFQPMRSVGIFTFLKRLIVIGMILFAGLLLIDHWTN